MPILIVIALPLAWSNVDSSGNTRLWLRLENRASFPILVGAEVRIRVAGERHVVTLPEVSLADGGWAEEPFDLLSALSERGVDASDLRFSGSLKVTANVTRIETGGQTRGASIEPHYFHMDAASVTFYSETTKKTVFNFGALKESIDLAGVAFGAPGTELEGVQIGRLVGSRPIKTSKTSVLVEGGQLA
jgi:hypothetical protein